MQSIIQKEQMFDKFERLGSARVFCSGGHGLGVLRKTRFISR